MEEGTEAALEAPAADDATGALFAMARAQLVAGAGSAPGSLFLFITLILFVVSVGPGATLSSIAVLVGVLVVHELGHYLGMRAFGYRDVRMFFVPFLGAAVSGRRGNVAAWKDAVVLLLGPVPGVLFGVAALLASARWPHPVLVDLGESFLLVNAFNLLPFGGLDGGKLLSRVIFARHRYLDVGFAALGSVALTLVAYSLGSFALAIFALFGLAGLPRRARLLEAAATLRPALADASAATLDDDAAWKLFDEARFALAPPASSDPRAIGRAMEDILLATKRAPGWLASSALLVVWAAACVVAFVAAMALAVAFAPAEWERRPFAGVSVELPDEPMHAEQTWSTPAGPIAAQIEWTGLDIVERFTVIQLDAGAEIAPADRPAWEAAARTRLEQDIGAQGASFVSERDLLVGGQPGVESVWSNGWRIWHVRTVVLGRRVLQLVASSPADTANASRFLDSFQLDAPAPAPMEIRRSP